MIRSIWFIIKLSLLIAAAVWVAEHPGEVRVDWLDYSINAHIGFALIGLIALVIIASYAGRFFAYITHFPEKWDRYKYMTGSKSGMSHLTRAYAALAGGDIMQAKKDMRKADKTLPDDFHRALIHSLGAQIAKQDGDAHARRQSLAKLVEMDDVAVFGLRGILHDLIEAGDYKRAKAFLDAYMSKHRNQPWLLKYRYALALEMDDWDEVAHSLQHSKIARILDKNDIRKNLVATLILQADEDLKANETHKAVAKLRRALKLEKDFVPAATRLASLYLDIDKVPAARALLSRLWERNGHRDMIYLWDRIHSRRKRKSSATRIAWFKKLIDKNPHAADGYLALAQVAMEEKQYGITREALEKAEEINPSARLYYQWADFEDQVNKDVLAVNAYLRKAGEAKKDKRWVCTKTGHVYERWSPIAHPHGAFNTIEWMIPPNLQDRSAHLATPSAKLLQGDTA